MKKRTFKEVQAAEEEMFRKVWYERHRRYRDKYTGHTPEDIIVAAEKAARKVEKEFPEMLEAIHDPFECGMLNGKLSALRWVLGEEWDSLDT